VKLPHADECPEPPLACLREGESQRIAPELHRLNLLTVLDVGPVDAYCAAAARLRQTEEALEYMAKQGKRGRQGQRQVTNPLLRIASQAMNDMQRIGA
jgi:phage terminase small subunit